MACYIFSDAHLGANDPAKEKVKAAKIDELFAMVRNDGDRLVILGDLFDFWFEYKHVIPKDHHRVLFKLTDLLERGIRIDYVSGNHDFWMGDFFEKELGITVHRDAVDMEYDGKRIHFIHGDGLAKRDRGYRILKRILRNRVNIWLYRRLPPDWAIPLAKWVSGSSRKYTSVREEHTFAPDYAAYAEQKLKEGYDVVAIGHLHTPVFIKSENGIYINTGDFIDHFSYAKIGEGKVELEYLSRV
jgi:UDP-2,3-diacylglucosamine hydrolase